MGDISDMHDLKRFMRSPEGKAHLKGIRRKLTNRTIVNVDFSNEVHFISITLTLDNGEVLSVTQPSLDIAVLQKLFEDAIEREYYVDFPDRKPIE